MSEEDPPSPQPKMKPPNDKFIEKRRKVSPDKVHLDEAPLLSNAITLPKLKESDQVNFLVELAAQKVDELSSSSKAGGCIRAARPALNVAVSIIAWLAPLYVALYSLCWKAYRKLPKNAAQMVFGLALCFFGGGYFAVFAAVEAFRTMGFKRFWADVELVMLQGKRVLEAEARDDQVDADLDGIKDVKQMSPNDYVKHKFAVAMAAVENPKVLESAVGNLWSAYLALLATLRMQFARTVAIALGAAEMIRLPVIKAVVPSLVPLLVPDKTQWAETIINSTVNAVCIVVAMKIQEIISAFYSGLRGGKMFADGAIGLLTDTGYIAKVPGVALPFDHTKSYLDEMITYTLAAAGFIFQFSTGFSLPFPLNLVFFPLSIVEWFLRFQMVQSAEH